MGNAVSKVYSIRAARARRRPVKGGAARVRRSPLRLLGALPFLCRASFGFFCFIGRSFCSATRFVRRFFGGVGYAFLRLAECVVVHRDGVFKRLLITLDERKVYQMPWLRLISGKYGENTERCKDAVGILEPMRDGRGKRDEREKCFRNEPDEVKSLFDERELGKGSCGNREFLVTFDARFCEEREHRA